MVKKLSTLGKSPYVTFTKRRPSKASKLLTPTEVADLLRVPLSWVYSRSRRDAIPVSRLGKYLRFDQDQITAWALAGCPKH
jgi:excisionase family DNA binding protein